MGEGAELSMSFLDAIRLHRTLGRKTGTVRDGKVVVEVLIGDFSTWAMPLSYAIDTHRRLGELLRVVAICPERDVRGVRCTLRYEHEGCCSFGG